MRPTRLPSFLEEMKGLVRELPSRIARSARVGEGEIPRRRRFRRFHPMMFEEMMHMSGDPADPIGILVLASMVREDLPWFYEIALDVYHSLRDGDSGAVEREVVRLRRMSEVMMHGPLSEEMMMGLGGKEAYMFLMELPRTLDHMVRRCLERKKPVRRRRVFLLKRSHEREAATLRGRGNPMGSGDPKGCRL